MLPPAPAPSPSRDAGTRGFVRSLSSRRGFFQPCLARMISMRRRAASYLHDLVVNMVLIDIVVRSAYSYWTDY